MTRPIRTGPTAPGRPPLARPASRHRLTAIVAGATITAGSLAGSSLLGGAVTASAAPTAGPAAASGPGAVSPRADLGARYLARALGGRDYLRTSSGRADPSDTAQAVLAMAASGTQRNAAHRALRWLAGHVRPDITTAAPGRRVLDPGAISFLILDAHALGVSPRSFGGVDLVRALLASERTNGLFGRAAPTYAGAYRQGLSLAALAAAGVRATPAVSRAVRWLRTQQCASGGWEAYRSSTAKACAPRDPATFTGPDTNSTALAVEGLAAQGATAPHRVLGFLVASQSRDGGWGSYGAPSDADSTALVRQALVALHVAHFRVFDRSGGNPASVLIRNQLPSGAELYQRTTGAIPNLLATEQVVPALAQVALPVPPLG